MTNATFPSQDPLPQTQRPPNYTVGLLLCIFLPGSGFTYLGRWSWHLIWVLGLAVLNVVAFVAVASTGTFPLLLLPVLAYLGMLVHHHVVYGRIRTSWASGTRPALSDVAKVLLIVGHFFLNIAGTGILAAVLIPNLLGAQRRAYDTGAQSCARSIQTALAIAQIDNQTYPTTIDKTISGASTACAPSQVTVTGYSSESDYRFTVNDSRGRQTYAVTPDSVTAQP